MAQQERTVCILGCGFMGTALLNGILVKFEPGKSQVRKFFAAVQRSESANKLQQTFSGHKDVVEVVCNNNVQAVSEADVIVLGFLPGDVSAILGIPELREKIKGKLVVSMLAGISCQTISQVLDGDQTSSSNTGVVRVIPSIGAQINESASLISQSKIESSDMSFVQWLFGQVGTTTTVPEELLDAAVGLSASCHALVVTAMDSIVDGSVSRGINRATALNIAAQCLRGASSLLLDKMTVEGLKDSMSVPRGITTEAWINLEMFGVRKALSQTVRNAIDYAENMG